MKILMIDKYYFIKGGAERYYFELTKVLENHNHQVFPFAMKDNRNFATNYEDYFVENINYFHKSPLKKIIHGLSDIGKMFYSFEAKNKIERLIEKTQPDIAHLHMIEHQISPSILHSLKKYNIPVIQTVHQYKLVCPNYRLYNSRTEQICEKCLNHRYIHAALDRCHKGSFFASLLVSLETYFHKFFQIYEKNIDLFHVPSHFMGAKLKQGGIDANKIEHLFYTINIDEYKYNPNFEEYFVYFGRLSEEKGILTLLKAVKGIKGARFKIIGDGPEEVLLKDYVANNNLENNVEFLGKLDGEDLKTIVSKSKFIVVPSEWYDNSPLVIYEAFSMGKPVIGARAGGISELIDDGKNGLLFELGNVAELHEKLTVLMNDPQKIKKYGQKAREKAEKYFSPEPHYQKIIKMYQQLIEANNK